MDITVRRMIYITLVLQVMLYNNFKQSFFANNALLYQRRV